MQTGLIALEIAVRINKLDIDLNSIVREYGIDSNELEKEELVRILKNIDFKVKIKSIDIADTKKYPLPAIFLLKDNAYGVLLKANYDEQKVLIFIPGENKTKEITFAEFRDLSSGEFIILIHKMLNSQIKFGFKWFFHEILKFRQVILEVLMGSFVVQLFGLITPLFTQVILDKVIVHHSISTLDVLAFAFVFVTIFEFFLNITRNYIFIHTANKIDAKLGAKLFKHLFALPFMYFESRRVGDIIARIRELDNIRDFITSKSVSVVIDMFFSLVFVFMMFLYSVQLTLIVLGFITLIAILYVTITPELRNRLNFKFQMASLSNSYLVETVTGVQTVKSLAIEGTMQKKWENNLAKYLNSSFKLSSMGTFAGAISGLIQKLITIAILFIGVKLVIQNKLTIGQLIAFQMFANQFTNPVLRLVNLWNDFQQAILGVDRLGDILNHPVEMQSDKAITLPTIKGDVRFDAISFRYSANSLDVLNKVSFNVKAGMSIGLVGRSGSGKSTIAKLIQRLYYTTEGAIYIDDIDIRHMHPIWLRNNIGIVLQESYLFSGSIRENIALSRPDASMEMIIQASQIAGAHEFISQLPEGYDTFVGERGSTLSGGQKQRIAIARALITNPKLLIFDEATSALDYESERIIQQNLDIIRQNRTIFMIAHRLSTVIKCDLIIALDKGQILEMGTHKELMEKRGYYHHLYTQQESADV